jgi:hypothetical protein
MSGAPVRPAIEHGAERTEQKGQPISKLCATKAERILWRI